MDSLHDQGASGNHREALAVEVAWFPYMKSRKPGRRCLNQLLDDIQNGAWRAQVDCIRAILARSGKDAYNKDKVTLPSFYISGTASTPATMLTHSGFLVVDLDDLDDRLEEIRSRLITDSHAAAVFISPSGAGVKIVIRIKPLDEPLDKNEHERAFAAVAAYFQDHYGVTPDSSGRNVNRHCLVSYDPNLYRNAQALPFDWPTCETRQEEEGERRDSSLSSLTSPCSLRSLTSLPSAEDGTTFEIFDPEPIEQAFANAHPDLARLYGQLLGKRQRPKQRTRNQCAVDIATFLLRAVGKKTAMLMLGHWYDLHHRGRFKDSREQHLADAKAQWENSLVPYVENLSKQEQQCYLAIPSDAMKAAFRIFRDCALSPSDEPPPNFHMSWKQLSIRLGVTSDRAGDIFDSLIRAKIIELIATPVMYGKGVIGRSTRYRWLL